MTATNTRCPPDSVLSDFGLGKLDASTADIVTRHLDTCADCQARVAGLPGDTFVGRLRQAGAKLTGRRDRTYVPGESLANAANSTDGSTSLGNRPRLPEASSSQTADAAADQSNRGRSLYDVSAPPELANHPDYELIKELGQGGMGTVYLAKNRMMDRLEVLKVVSKSLLEKPGAMERFQQEIRSAAKLAHPNIVAAYSVLRPGDLLVFAMEYVKGHDLAQVVKGRGYLPVANAAFYIHQVANGLQHAFEKGMVHRDIKPNNLMLAIEGKKHVVKILDFGLAKATSEKGAQTGLTKSGQMLGTPDYVAPEQTLDAHKADIRADIYSLGCTLYFLLSGGPPFQEASLYEILEAHHKRDPKPLNLVRPDVPVELATVVAKMMAKDPAKRYQTPIEVAKALLPFFKPGQTTSAPPAEQRRAEEEFPRHGLETFERLLSATPPDAVGQPLSPSPTSIGSLPMLSPAPATALATAPVAVVGATPLSRVEPAKLLGLAIDVRRPTEKRRNWWFSLPPWQRWTALGAAAAALLLGVVVLVRTRHGAVEIALSDKNANVRVTVDGDHVDIHGLDKPPQLAMPEQIEAPVSPSAGKNDVGPPAALARPAVVPTDAEIFGGHWYRFYPEQLNWKAARDRCTSYGGHLVVFDSLAENDFVARLVEKVAWHAAWIGITDEAEEGTWRTVDGGPVQFKNWFKMLGERKINQPNNEHNIEHYALISDERVGRSPPIWRWWDEANESNHFHPGFVCEWEPKLAAPLPLTTPPEPVSDHGDVKGGGAPLPVDVGEQDKGPPSAGGGKDDDSVPSRPAPPDVVEKSDGFVALFNGKDLAGWKTHPSQKGNWRVEHGILIGAGPKLSHLYSQRGDFTDFHLRVEARVNKGGDSGVYIRSNFGPTWGLAKKSRSFPAGYAAQIYGTGPGKHKTGSLLVPHEWLVVKDTSVEGPNKWFTLEFIAEGNHVVVKVNGQTTADYTDGKRRFSKGHIALQQNPNTGIQFRKIEIRESSE